MKKFILPMIMGFNLSLAHALEIDEKLTLRFLKVSGSKKTVLINRGGEDGLVVGDHAKFFITAGVIARGVAEKVSPSRSIWSLYRVVDPAEITEDKVLNLKIASPVKITEDPTKSMKEEEIPGGTESMPMEETPKAADDASEKEIVVDEADQAELESMGIESDTPAKKAKPVAQKKSKASAETTEVLELPTTVSGSRNDVWEVWGMLYLNSLSGTAETSTTSADTSSSTFDFSGGVERYFHNSNGFFKDVSLSLFLHKRTTETGSDVTLSSDWTEYGLGINYHFYNRSYDVNRPVVYVPFTIGKGSVSHESKIANSATGVVPEEGDSSFFSFGLGAKYQLTNGFGARAILDYYSGKEAYSFSDGTESERSLSGPRLQFGLSYRF